MSTINNRLKRLREIKGKTQTEFGIILGLKKDAAQTYISRYEKGTTIPLELTHKIKEVYPREYSWFMFGEENENEKNIQKNLADNETSSIFNTNEDENDYKFWKGRYVEAALLNDKYLDRIESLLKRCEGSSWEQRPANARAPNFQADPKRRVG